MRKVKPLGARVLIKPLVEDQVSRGGIILPGMQRDAAALGEVVEVSDLSWIPDDRTPTTCPVAVGDHVVYSIYAGTEMKLRGEEYRLLAFTDIGAILLPEEAEALAGTGA